MWKDLLPEEKEEYKKLILAFSSLTEMFCQKSVDDEILTPIINSKYQETIFQKVFGASAEDIGNTSYDASLKLKKGEKEYKYLIGIKTFGINSGDQKIAQFKKVSPQFSETIEIIKRNRDENNDATKDELDELNNKEYLKIARYISKLRNDRIDSAIENLKGFKIKDSDNVQSIYHVLMPSKKGNQPEIFVGETSYDKIDINNIKINGSTSINNVTNFTFTDGNHQYKYTSSDSQLYMKFNNKDIVVDEWKVIYADKAYDIFKDISNKVYNQDLNNENEITESYSWYLLNKNGEVELFSGFNGFYAVGSKMSKEYKEKRYKDLYKKYKNVIPENILKDIYSFLFDESTTKDLKIQKSNLRSSIIKNIKKLNQEEFINDIYKLLYRPFNEMYIPIPNSKYFHTTHPNFFAKNIGSVSKNGNKEKFVLNQNKEERKFNLIFEPSGDCITSYITQDNGKAIESYEKQSYLGEWILRNVFRLEKYEPLTSKKMNELGINGIRLYKLKNSEDIHIKFIWIDEDCLPDDYCI